MNNDFYSVYILFVSSENVEFVIIFTILQLIIILLK